MVDPHQILSCRASVSVLVAAVVVVVQAAFLFPRLVVPELYHGFGLFRRGVVSLPDLYYHSAYDSTRV